MRADRPIQSRFMVPPRIGQGRHARSARGGSTPRAVWPWGSRATIFAAPRTWVNVHDRRGTYGTTGAAHHVMRYRAWRWIPAVCLAAAGCEGVYYGVGFGGGVGFYAPYAVTYVDDSYYDAGVMYGVYDPYYDDGYYGPVDFSASALEASSGGARPPSDPAAIAPEQIAKAAADAAPSYFTPSGCVTATANGAAVDYQFADCTGPLGQRVSGALTVTFADGQGRIEARAIGDGLVVNGAALHVDVTARYTFGQGMKTLEVSSKTARVGSSNIRDARFTMTWSQGSGCVAIDGQGTMTIDDAPYEVTMNDITRCANRCPESGTITFSGPNGAVNMAFDGTRTATSSAAGSIGTVTLSCEE